MRTPPAQHNRSRSQRGAARDPDHRHADGVRKSPIVGARSRVRPLAEGGHARDFSARTTYIQRGKLARANGWRDQTPSPSPLVAVARCGHRTVPAWTRISGGCLMPSGPTSAVPDFLVGLSLAKRGDRRILEARGTSPSKRWAPTPDRRGSFRRLTRAREPGLQAAFVKIQWLRSIEKKILTVSSADVTFAKSC